MYIPTILQPYLVGIIHSVITVLFIYLFLLLSLFSGLAFLLELTESTILFLVVLVVLATTGVSFLLRKAIKKAGSASRIVLAASVTPVFILLKMMLVQFYATYSMQEILVGSLPVLFYIATLIGSVHWVLRK